jgi:hypothetical protein
LFSTKADKNNKHVVLTLKIAESRRLARWGCCYDRKSNRKRDETGVLRMEALVLTATASTTTKVVRDYKRSNLEWWLAADGLLPVDIATCFLRGVFDRCGKCVTP